MGRPAVALLIAGRPGVGKTTLLKRLAALLGEQAGGFYTEEIREGRRRVGFRLVTLEGQSAVLAHVDWPGPPRVGRYGVDLRALEEVGVPALQRALAARRLVIVDEIGKMELLSPAFRAALEAIIGAGRPLLATVMLAPDPWVEALKRRPEVRVILLTEANREAVLQEVIAWLKQWGIDQGAPAGRGPERPPA